jgi:Co/Zn/Cd efflux system component
MFSFQVSPIYPHEAPKVKCKTKVDLLILCSLFVLFSIVDFYYGIFIGSYGMVAH